MSENLNQNQGNPENNQELNVEVIKNYLETNKDNEDIKGLLGAYVPEKEIDIDVVKKYLNESKDGQSFYDSAKNQHLETWKKNNLDKIIEEELKTRGVVEDETTKKIRELEKKMEEANQKALMAELNVKAKDYAKEKNLPFELVGYFLGGDEEQTIKNLETFETVWSNAIQQALEGKIGEYSREPRKGNKEDTEILTREQFKKLTYSERVKLKNENPELYNKLARG